MVDTVGAGRWVVLLFVAFAAGTVDAIVGGGGLIQLPGLLIGLPSQPVAALLGTNKIASVLGTGSAAVVYNRRVQIDRSQAFAMAAVAGVGALGGATVATHVSGAALKPIVAVALSCVWVYVWRRPELGQGQRHERVGEAQRCALAAIGGAIGFYDGFVGPGTGSMLVFALVGLAGLNFLHAGAIAKVVNFATNLGAIVVFASGGHLLLGLGLCMGLANAAGAQLGARAALGRGTQWVRKVFLVVVAALLVRLCYDFVVTR